jgi:hypothetical protein
LPGYKSSNEKLYNSDRRSRVCRIKLNRSSHI